MAQPQIKRYALVADRSANGVRSFQLARVESGARARLGSDRLERMEEIAERDRQRAEGGAGPR
jgi:hypothetical protein